MHRARARRIMLRKRQALMRLITIPPRCLLVWPCVVASAVLSTLVYSGPATAVPINTVFVIAMENHNWTQPSSDTSAPQQIFNNANAPFINSIVNSAFNGGALNPKATLFGTASPISIYSHVSYATAYHNVLAGGSSHIH